MKDSAKRDFDGYNPVFYGAGILDLEAALSPLGQVSISGSTLESTRLSVPATLQAEVSRKLEKVAVLDRFNRDFRTDLSARVSGRAGRVKSADALLHAASLSRFSAFRMDQGHTAMMLNAAGGTGSMMMTDKTSGMIAGFGDQSVDPLMMVGGVPSAMLTLAGDSMTAVATMGFASDQGITMFNLGVVDKSAGEGVRAGLVHGILMGENGDHMLTLGIEAANGPGAFGFTGQGATRLNGDAPLLMSMGYMHNPPGSSIWVKVRYGALGDVGGNDMITFDDVRLGQMVLGYARTSHNGRSRFGIQAWSDLRPVSGTFRWKIPVGMNDQGVMQHATGGKAIGRRILPDSLTLYYDKRF